MPAEQRFSGHGPDWEYGAGIDLRWWLRIIEAITYIGVGANYTFGPPSWRSSDNFAVISVIPIPIQMWSALMLVGGILLLVNLYPYNWIPYGLLFVVSAFWGVAEEMAVLMAPPLPLPGSHVAGGAPFWVLGVAAFNALFLVTNAKEFTMRRAEDV